MANKYLEAFKKYDSQFNARQATSLPPTPTPAATPTPKLRQTAPGRPTLDVGDLIDKGVFKSAEPQRSTAERVVRGIRVPLQAIGRAATLNIGGSGGLIERGLSGIMGADINQTFTPETTTEKGLALGGEIVGSAVPIGGLYKLSTPLAARVLPNSTRLPARLLREAVPGAASMGAYEGLTSAAEGNPLQQVAKDTLTGAVMGGVGDVATRGVITGLSRVIKNASAKKTQEEAFKTGMDVGEKLDVKPNIPPVKPPDLPNAQAMPSQKVVNGPDLSRTVRSGAKTVPPPKITKDISQKEPWEMTKEEWRQVGDNGLGKKYLPYARTKTERALNLGVDLKHEAIIKDAIEKGKPVPEEVIRDYPRLSNSAPRMKVAVDTFGTPKKTPTPARIRLAQRPMGQETLLPGNQKARQFPLSTANSQMASEELKKGILSEVRPGGRGAYDPITLKGMDEEARRFVDNNAEGAYRYIINEREPSALHTATGIRLIERFQNEGNYERAIDVSMSLAEKLTKQGQAISAARIVQALNPDGVLVFAQRQINKINREKKLNTKDLQLTPEMAQSLKELAQRMQNATDDAARLEASQELQAALNSLKPSGIGKKIATTQTIAQLLNPKTIIRNVVGNELFYRLERLNKLVATPIDWARTKLTGGQRTVTFSTAGQGGYWEGFIKGAKAGWKGVSPQGITTQYDLGNGPAFNIKGNFASKTMAYLERAMGATLKGFDHAAYTRAKNQTLGELATLRAINTFGKADPAVVKKFMAEAEDNLLNIADQYGKYVTFQDDNIISNTLVKTKRALNAGQDFGVGDLLLKYPKTPGALIARGLEYSPLGILKAGYQLAKVKGIFKGTPDVREVTLALSRAITGSAGLTVAGYFLADKGIITGSMDKDADVRALQQQTGEGPYRVNVSALTRWVRNGFNQVDITPREGDTIINYDWAQPVAMAISAGANINQSIKEKATAEDKAKGLAGTLAGSLEGAVNTIAEQPVLRGLTRIVQGYDPGQSLINVAKDIPSSFTPTLGNQFRQLSDNTSRSTYDPNPAKEALNKVKLKLPVVSGTLPKNYTTLGQVKENYQDGSNNLFNVFLNPSFVSQYKLTPEAKMVVDTFRESGETKQIPRVVPKKFIVSGKSFVLSPQEYSEFQRIVGEITRDKFSKIPATDSTEKKIDKMTDILTESGRTGKEAILKARGERTEKYGKGLRLK